MLTTLLHRVKRSHVILEHREGGRLLVCRTRVGGHVKRVFYMHPNGTAFDVPDSDAAIRIMGAATTLEISRILHETKAEVVQR
jgi:hypothetical protein